MGSYDLVFKPAVAGDLRRFPPVDAGRVLKAIERLSNAPLSPRAAKLSGTERLYRVRVGVYRVIYEVDVRGRRVTIHYVRHRRDAYRRV